MTTREEMLQFTNATSQKQPSRECLLFAASAAFLHRHYGMPYDDYDVAYGAHQEQVMAQLRGYDPTQFQLTSIIKTGDVPNTMDLGVKSFEQLTEYSGQYVDLLY